MFVLLKENNITYIALSISSIMLDGYDQSAFRIEENLPMWKVKGSKNTVMAVFPSFRDADILRYQKLKAPLTYTNLVSQINPQFKQALANFGRLNSEDHMVCEYFIAKDSDAYFVSNNEIKKVDVFSDQVGLALLTPSLMIYKDKKPVERLLRSFILEKEDLFRVTFPIAIIDTKSEKINYYESLEDL